MRGLAGLRCSDSGSSTRNQRANDRLLQRMIEMRTSYGSANPAKPPNPATRGRHDFGPPAVGGNASQAPHGEPMHRPRVVHFAKGHVGDVHPERWVILSPVAADYCKAARGCCSKHSWSVLLVPCHA